MRDYVQRVYGPIPEITALYDELPVTVMRTDLFRMLALLADGGIYTDVDTELLKPIARWPINPILFDDALELVANVECVALAPSTMLIDRAGSTSPT